MEEAIKMLATKYDTANGIASIKDDLAKFKSDLSKQIDNSIRWMFVFWLGQVAAMLAIVFLFPKK